MAYENYNIEQFENAWFKKDYSGMSKEEFDVVYAEYQDTSGLFLTDDFEKQSYIVHLSQRINCVKIFIRLQREFISDFHSPFIRDFAYFKDKYGYALKWIKDEEDFEEQLQKVEKREIKHNTSLEDAIKELNDYRVSKSKGVIPEDDDVSLRKSRLSFIRMRNSLGKIGYDINKKITTVEEFALMIKQQIEEVEEISNRHTNGR